jgi:hypothetical protein
MRYQRDSGRGSPSLLDKLSPLMKHPLSRSNTANSVSSSLHPRRTLDQFYYPSLEDTSARDADQTISKWSDRGSNRASKGKWVVSDDSLLIMVDQLWCWVLDESKLPEPFVFKSIL